MPAERTVRIARQMLTLLLCATLGGCTWLLPRLRSPQVRVVAIHVRSADFWQQRLRVRLQVRNPNDIRLPIEAIHYTLRIDGETVAHGHTVAPFTVAAHGSAQFNTYVTANMAGALLSVFAAGRRHPVRYQLRGEVDVAHALLHALPFDVRGQFNLR